MTNNKDIDLTALGAPDIKYKVPDTFKMTHHPDGTTTTEGMEPWDEIVPLPWSTEHLVCKCGHKWDDHHSDAGCKLCGCTA